MARTGQHILDKQIDAGTIKMMVPAGVFVEVCFRPAPTPHCRCPGHQRHRMTAAYGCCGQALTSFTGHPCIGPGHRQEGVESGDRRGASGDRQLNRNSLSESSVGMDLVAWRKSWAWAVIWQVLAGSGMFWWQLVDTFSWIYLHSSLCIYSDLSTTSRSLKTHGRPDI